MSTWTLLGLFLLLIGSSFRGTSIANTGRHAIFLVTISAGGCRLRSSVMVTDISCCYSWNDRNGGFIIHVFKLKPRPY